MLIRLYLGDITRLETDAIVNAANPSLLGGGGVDGAIHRAAGPLLRAYCEKLGGARPGEAKLTPGYNLKSRYIIHTVGPIWRGGGENEPLILQSAYENSLALADEKGLLSIAFPAISTGVYGYPPEPACRLAVDTVLRFEPESLRECIFALFSRRDYEIYKNYLDKENISYLSGLEQKDE